MTACLPKASYSIASAGRHKSKSIDRTICLAKPCNGSADLAKAVPNELAARTIAVTIRRAIIGILPSLLEAVADRLRNALNHVGRATRLSPIFPEQWPMSNANKCQTERKRHGWGKSGAEKT